MGWRQYVCLLAACGATVQLGSTASAQNPRPDLQPAQALDLGHRGRPGRLSQDASRLVLDLENLWEMVVFDAETGKQISGKPMPSRALRELTRQEFAKLDAEAKKRYFADKATSGKKNQVETKAEKPHIGYRNPWLTPDGSLILVEAKLQNQNTTAVFKADDIDTPLAKLDNRFSRGSGKWTFSSDGTFALPAYDGNFQAADRRLCIYDLTTGKIAAEFPDVKFFVSACIYPKADRIAYSDQQGNLSALDVAAGTTAFKHSIKSGGQYAHVICRPDGRQLAALYGGRGFAEVHVFDAKTGRPLATHKQVKLGFPILYSPDGRLIAGKQEQKIKLIDATTGREVMSLAGVEGFLGILDHDSVAFSGDGKRLACWTARSGKLFWWELAK